MNHRDLTCDEVESLLPLIADGALEPSDDPALFDHLSQCADCQASLAQHDLISLALSTNQPPAPEAKVIQFVRFPLAAAAAWLIGIAGLGYGLYLNQQPGSPQTPHLANQNETQVVGERINDQGERAFILRVNGQTIETPVSDTPSQEINTNNGSLMPTQHQSRPSKIRR